MLTPDLIVVLVVVFIGLLCVYGYLMNIVKLFNDVSLKKPITGLIFLRIFGIFAYPLGIILGFIR